MILPMKKVSILVLDTEKKQALSQLRRLGLVHVEVSQGTGETLAQLKERSDEIERALFAIEETKTADAQQVETSLQEALDIARQIAALCEERKNCYSQVSVKQAELERLTKWGDFDPADLELLARKGVNLSLYEMPQEVYRTLCEDIPTVFLGSGKTSVRCLVWAQPSAADTGNSSPIDSYKVTLPAMSISRIREDVAEKQGRISAITEQIKTFACRADGMKQAIAALQKEITFENYALGMAREVLSENPDQPVAVACLNGYIPTEDLNQLKATAKQNAWGLIAEDPTAEDNVPTKLRNNKFVSLIYPLTDFLGTVPGYFESDISGWFLGFMLIFFGIIFGDGGYGILILGVAVALIFKARAAKEPVPPMYLLIALFGGATLLWGMLTCTWFGLTPDQLPGWLKSLSLPVISNVNADRLWYPFWTNGEAGLTTAQNVQIFCFTLALVQLTVAHIKGMIANRGSLKILGELGSILQLWGIFYVVLCLVVNGQVFSLGLVISGIPVGTIALISVGIGFVLGFIFGSYEGSIKDSILDSCKNIVSILLGVVNVFSDIVSYIRLWAVGLAGAAISATVNEMAGPMLGRLTFIVFAVILLVFGHGLNMVLNLLSVIVHGVRLNTLEFSTHLGITWSGHKFEPFEE